jgi:hypothetical protein
VAQPAGSLYYHAAAQHRLHARRPAAPPARRPAAAAGWNAAPAPPRPAPTQPDTSTLKSASSAGELARAKVAAQRLEIKLDALAEEAAGLKERLAALQQQPEGGAGGRR